MTSSSDRRSAPRQVPPPQGSTAKPASPYTRFIPSEEVQSFAAWTPDALQQRPGAAQPTQPDRRRNEPPTPPTEKEISDLIRAARQAGYHDGYRDGLVALEGFKQSFAQQATSQVGTLVKNFDAELSALEQLMAATLADTAVQLARQVVRCELRTQPELIAQVASEAVNAVLLSARHITVLVHPDDQALVAEGAEEALKARGARLMASPLIERGGCVVESDVGSIDAAIATRWAQAANMLGSDPTWHPPEAEPDTPHPLDDHTEGAA